MELKLVKFPIMSVSKDLTLGKVYECREPYLESDHYEVIDDAGDGHEVEKECLESVVDWSGEGRPPIGTVCEVGYRDSWVPATVLALDHNVIVVRYQLSDKSVSYSGFDINNVRPIKSQKQKEIDKITSELLESVNKNGEDFKHLEGPIAEHLYNAGLRFTEDSK